MTRRAMTRRLLPLQRRFTHTDDTGMLSSMPISSTGLVTHKWRIARQKRDVTPERWMT